MIDVTMYKTNGEHARFSVPWRSVLFARRVLDLTRKAIVREPDRYEPYFTVKAGFISWTERVDGRE